MALPTHKPIANRADLLASNLDGHDAKVSVIVVWECVLIACSLVMRGPVYILIRMPLGSGSSKEHATARRIINRDAFFQFPASSTRLYMSVRS